MKLKLIEKPPAGNIGKPVQLCACGSIASSGRPVVIPKWAIGTYETVIGPVLSVSTALSRLDIWEHFKCRTTSFRNHYTVQPGLYAVGSPDNNSDVLVSANYKYSFDCLRSEISGMNVWLLVLDTKGINVWCAAGKGTFGTAELIRRIGSVKLNSVIAHKRVIVPQLGAPGICAYQVTKATGFRVLFGPIAAKDLRSYIDAGYKASMAMRTMPFTCTDRLVLTPMEINPAMKKYPWFALVVLVFFGLHPSGILFKEAVLGGMPFLLMGLLAVMSGALLTPLLLPLFPFRSFALKGWITGLAMVAAATFFIPGFRTPDTLLSAVTWLFFPAASSYLALQFTGSTTFTGMTGVNKELRISIPLSMTVCAVTVVLLALYKINHWGSP